MLQLSKGTALVPYFTTGARECKAMKRNRGGPSSKNRRSLSKDVPIRYGSHSDHSRIHGCMPFLSTVRSGMSGYLGSIIASTMGNPPLPTRKIAMCLTGYPGMVSAIVHQVLDHFTNVTVWNFSMIPFQMVISSSASGKPRTDASQKL